jgi:hypothetical protein
LSFLCFISCFLFVFSLFFLFSPFSFLFLFFFFSFSFLFILFLFYFSFLFRLFFFSFSLFHFSFFFFSFSFFFLRTIECEVLSAARVYVRLLLSLPNRLTPGPHPPTQHLTLTPQHMLQQDPFLDQHSPHPSPFPPLVKRPQAG